MNLAEIALRPGREPARADHPAFRDRGRCRSAMPRFRRWSRRSWPTSGKLGVKPGDKVLFRMTNSAEFAAAFLACVWLGAIPVLQNSQLGRSELEHIVDLSRPGAVSPRRSHARRSRHRRARARP